MRSEFPSVIDGLDVNEVKDGLVVYDPSHDRVHYLNPTAAVVFSLCDGTRDVAALAAMVAAAFGALEPAMAEVESCLAQLEREGVLR